MAAAGTAVAPAGAIIAGKDQGGATTIADPGAIGEGGELLPVDALAEPAPIEMSECGIQVGDLDEFAEYFECFLKIGDCLPKIIVCGTDDEMPRIVVCEGLKRRPAVDATQETKKVLLEIQSRVAEMINAIQINTILREEINHIEGDCPVIKLKEVMKRIKETQPDEEPEICQPTPTRVSCCAFAAKSTTRNNSLRSFRSSAKSRESVTDSIKVMCSMCVSQPVGYCRDCGGYCQPSPSMESMRPQSKASDMFTDDDVKAIIDKCLGPPCTTCVADKYDTLVDDLDVEATNLTHTGQTIYDIIVPPGYKDQQGWGANHNIQPSYFPPQVDSVNTQRFADTVVELQGELSKLDQLGEVLTCRDTLLDNRVCESSSCVNAANYLNNQIAQIEEDLDVLRTCLERSRKERKKLEAQEKPCCLGHYCFQ